MIETWYRSCWQSAAPSWLVRQRNPFLTKRPSQPTRPASSDATLDIAETFLTFKWLQTRRWRGKMAELPVGGASGRRPQSAPPVGDSSASGIMQYPAEHRDSPAALQRLAAWLASTNVPVAVNTFDGR